MMVIENIMYFALGLLLAGLVALAVMPAVWKRAVRLTKRRIEAATPITMAEFRADKDQLRAEFALSTRKLEMTVEALRKKLAEQLSDVASARTDLGALKAERDQHAQVVAELESRAAELSARVLELERESTDLAQRLRMGERELGVRNGEIESLRQIIRGDLPNATDLDDKALTGEYDADIERLSTALLIERKRADLLEEQAANLLGRLDGADIGSAKTKAAIAQMRDALARKDDKSAVESDNLVVAEARLASAEHTLNAILAEADAVIDPVTGKGAKPLAERLTLEADVEALRLEVQGIETSILEDWGSERTSEDALRGRLTRIAANVSRLVYADQSEAAPGGEEESLFERVQRFADDGKTVELMPVKPAGAPKRKGKVSDRMAAMRETQGR
jgi:chromosome segregation ATPase